MLIHSGKEEIYSKLFFHLSSFAFAYVVACGQVDRALDSRSEGLGFDFQCWPYVEVSGKLHIPHCLGPSSRNGYLVYRSKVGLIVAGYISTHLARGKVKSVGTCRVLESGQQLSLPLPL